MENIEFLHAQLSLAREIAVSHKNNILTDGIFLQISGKKQISAQPVINGTTVSGKATILNLISVRSTLDREPLLSSHIGQTDISSRFRIAELENLTRATTI